MLGASLDPATVSDPNDTAFALALLALAILSVFLMAVNRLYGKDNLPKQRLRKATFGVGLLAFIPFILSAFTTVSGMEDENDKALGAAFSIPLDDKQKECVLDIAFGWEDECAISVDEREGVLVSTVAKKSSGLVVLVERSEDITG